MRLAMFVATLAVVSLLVFSGDIGADASATDEVALRQLRTLTDVETRIELIISLENRSSEPVRKALENIAVDASEPGEVRMQAICSLGGSANRESVPVLLKLIERDLKERRGFWACAIPLLGELEDRRAVALLLRIADLNEEHLAGMDHMAIEALAKLGDERELAVLSGKVHIAPVRLAVMKGLARIASPQSTDILISGLIEGEEPDVVEAARSGLLKIGKAAVPALNMALTEYDDQELASRIKSIPQQLKP